MHLIKRLTWALFGKRRYLKAAETRLSQAEGGIPAPMYLTLRAMLFVALTVAISHAAPITTCPPDFVNDSKPVAASCPGIGADVQSRLGSTWLVAFNDNNGLPGDDQDFNDFWFRVTFGSSTAQLTYGGSLAAWINTLYFESDPIWTNHLTAPGAVASISLAATSDPVEFRLSSFGLFGLQSLTTGTDSAYVICERGCDEIQVTSTPEPTSFALACFGVGMMFLGISRRAR